MINLYYWPTPNGHKITLFLEEAGLPYKIHPVNIMKGDQFKGDFLAISPNNKMPAILDDVPVDNNGPMSVFESGAILWYLAEKTQSFIPHDARGKVEVSTWLFWQMAGLGPMAGQNHHFNKYAPEKIPYAIERYTKETARLYGVLNKHMEGRDWVAGNMYTIADMAIYPWIVPHQMQGQDLGDYQYLKAWFERIADRPAVKKAYEIGSSISEDKPMTDEARKHLFGQ